MARSVSHLLRVLETFNALGIAFVSLTEQVDTTPAGKMVFTVLGAVAELERSLIVERVKAGLRNARAKGKRLGRPSTGIDRATVETLRRQGAIWRAIAMKLGVGSRNALSLRAGAFQNSGKGFWNAIGARNPLESILSVKDGVVHVRPKLFGDVEDAIQGDLRHPLLAGLGPSAFLRGIIEVRDACPSSISYDFREIDSLSA